MFTHLFVFFRGHNVHKATDNFTTSAPTAFQRSVSSLKNSISMKKKKKELFDILCQKSPAIKQRDKNESDKNRFECGGVNENKRLYFI